MQGEDTNEELVFISEKYSTDINVEQLQVELKTFEVMFKEENIVCFEDLITLTQSLPREEKKLVENVIKICKLLAVNPTTSATAERTFSMARRVKTWMRSTMLPSRFNSLAVLNFHKVRTDT